MHLPADCARVCIAHLEPVRGLLPESPAGLLSTEGMPALSVGPLPAVSGVGIPPLLLRAERHCCTPRALVSGPITRSFSPVRSDPALRDAGWSEALGGPCVLERCSILSAVAAEGPRSAAEAPPLGWAELAASAGSAELVERDINGETPQLLPGQQMAGRES